MKRSYYCSQLCKTIRDTRQDAINAAIVFIKQTVVIPQRIYVWKCEDGSGFSIYWDKGKVGLWGKWNKNKLTTTQ